MNKKKFFLIFALLIFLPFILKAQTSPEEFLGHKVGEDRKLADYTQVQAYFEKLDQDSRKMEVLTIGESTLGKPIIMGVITSEENMTQLDKFREITRKLRNARDLTSEEAMQLADEGKVMVLFTCNLHSTEIASSQMAMEFVYNLVSGKTPFDSTKVLNDVIILIVPTTNPDGLQMVTEWYRKYVGTEYEGGQMPWLYHHYAGHDNNRDWYMLNLSETNAVSKIAYHEWIPQILFDQHQMGSTGARLWIPPFFDPPNPNIHPLIWRGVGLCGMNMAYDLQKNERKGVAYGGTFTGWWSGGCEGTAWYHNTIGILSEAASVNMATPIYIEPTEIPETYVEKRMQFIDPWPGGWWRLRDIVDYELEFSQSLVKTAHLHKVDILFNFYKMCKDSIENRTEGQPFAFIIPVEQHDNLTCLKMLEVLMLGGVEIQQAKEDFTAGGRAYKAGSFVVLMSQPYRPYAKALLERQKYPDIRQYPGGPPVPPYDSAGWTLPLQMGVNCDQIDVPFRANLSNLDKISYPSVTPHAEMGSYVILDSRLNNSYSVIFPLIKEKAEIYRSVDIISEDGFKAEAGSFIIKNTPQVQKILPDLLEKKHLEFNVLEDISNIPKKPLRRHRIGLYQSWRSNMDEGWSRYVFDDFDIPYTTLHNNDFKGKEKKKVFLKEQYDVIIFPDESADIIKLGKPKDISGYRRYSPLPPEYEGGIGAEGVEAVKTFVDQGGILIMLNNACELIFQEFSSPADNVLKNIDRTKFFCPSSLLKINVDNKSPIGYGMPKQAAAMYYRSPVLNTRIPSGNWERKVVASYADEDILLSGWLLGEDIIARKAAVVDLQCNRGHIILIGLRCQNRAQSHGTYKFLFNGLLYPEEE